MNLIQAWNESGSKFGCDDGAREKLKMWAVKSKKRKKKVSVEEFWWTAEILSHDHSCSVTLTASLLPRRWRYRKRERVPCTFLLVSTICHSFSLSFSLFKRRPSEPNMYSSAENGAGEPPNGINGVNGLNGDIGVNPTNGVNISNGDDIELSVNREHQPLTSLHRSQWLHCHLHSHQPSPDTTNTKSLSTCWRLQ